MDLLHLGLPHPLTSSDIYGVKAQSEVITRHMLGINYSMCNDNNMLMLLKKNMMEANWRKKEVK